MSDHDIATEHSIVDGEQRTTKRVNAGGDTYEFEGEPGGEFEYQGEATPPAEVLEAVDDHLGADEQLVDENGDPFSLEAEPSSTTSSADSSGASDDDVAASIQAAEVTDDA